MKKKILAAVCVICTCATSFTALFSPIASATTEGQYITYGDLVSAKPGNIFYGNEQVVFKIDVQNPNSFKVYGRYSYTITDEAGQTVYINKPSDLVGLGAKQQTTRTIKLPQIEKYGIYKLTLTEESNNDNSTTGMVSAEFTAEFSVCIPLGEGNANEDFGFNQKIVNSGNYPDGVTLMKNAGATWHREDVLWQGVEPIGGSNGEKYIDLGPYKAKLEEMKKRGINTVCILNGRNELYCEKTDSGLTKMPTSDEAIAAYAEFCAYVAGELKDVVDHYEIYNEWNNQNFNPSQETPETYAKVLEAAYRAIKNVDQNITVIGCDTMGMPTAWIGRVLQEGGGAYMDAISVHCYDYTAEDGFPEQAFKAKVEGFKAFLAERGFNKPIWLTEIGFSTYEGGRTQNEQLNAMVMLGAVNKAYGLVDKILLYALNDRFDDSGNTDPQKEEHNWGVLYNYKNAVPKNGAKKAYLGLAAMNYFIGGNAEYVNKTEDTDARQYAFEFYNRNLNKRVTLAMCGGIAQTAEMTLNIPSKSIDIYDKYGNFVYSTTSENGVYELDITSEPMYIVHGSAFSVTKNNVEVTGINEINSGDNLAIDLADIDTSAENQKVIVGQFGAGERFLKADSFIVNGNNNEFTGSFTVADGAERIVIVYWDMDNLNPLVDCCEIK